MLKKRMNQCSGCGQLYPKGRGCEMNYIEIAGVRYQRIKYGSSIEGFGPAISKCMGCGVHAGRNHHWLCSYEICPVCNQQLLTCNCNAKPIVVF